MNLQKLSRDVRLAVRGEMLVAQAKLSFATRRALFAGLALEGSVLEPMSQWNAAYYGREVGARHVAAACG